MFGEMNQFELRLHEGQIGVCFLLGQSIGFTLFTLFVTTFAQKPLTFWVLSDAKTQMQYESVFTPTLYGHGMLTVPASNL
jgi:hypothetical protein